MNQNGQTLCTDEETWFNLFQDTYSFHCGPKWRLEIRGSDFRVRQRTCGCADLRFQMIDDSSNIYEIYMRGGTYSVVNGGGPGGGGAPAPKTENVWFWTNTKYYNLQSGTPVDLGSYSGPCNPGNCDAGTM
ncbi:hypothetical protein BGZ73_009120 [Actinomortierella ambigua]|nr:hypothetical protein BGZ73_009120 [Actinomortierella ambigua]